VVFRSIFGALGHAAPQRRVHFVLAIVFSSAFLISCQRDPLREALQHIGRGDRYVEQKQYPEAIIEYRVAISLVDISSVAHFNLAEAYVKNDELLKAFPEYLKAADLAPERDDIQIKAGNLLLIAGRFPEARTRARAVLQRNPKSVPAIILLGHAVVGLKDFESAADLGRKAIELDPDRAGTYRNLAVIEMMRGNADSAQLAFKRAIEIDPHSVSAHLSLANLYRFSGAFAKAEEVIRQTLTLEPTSVAANNAMAGLYAEWGRATEAEPYLLAAAKSSNDINAQFAVADYYLALGRVDDSKRVLQTVVTSRPEGFVPATTRLAVIEYALGKRADGQKLMDAALAKEPKNPTALAMKSRLLLSDNKVDEALAAANAAVAAEPRAPEGFLALGRVYLVRQQRDDARKAFNEALKLGPSGIEPQLELAKLHLRRGEIDTAIDFATQGLKQAPHNLDAQLMLVRTMAARSDDKGEADAALRKLLGMFPKAPAAHNMAGTLALAKNNNKAARAAWDRALELDPNNAEALGGIAALYAAANQPGEAWRRVAQRLKVAPNNPSLLLLGAKIHIVQKDIAGAEDLLKKAVAADASNLDAYSLLGWIYVSQHRIEEARAQFTEMLRQEPTSVAVHTMLGLLSEAQKDVPGAVRWYQKALTLNPRAAVAANNLAWINVSRNTDLDGAMRLAEIARGELPNQAEFHDTLGWVCYKKQLTTNAIESLQRAVQLDSRNPLFRYHLGLAYVQEGTDPKARVVLEQALKLNPNFDGADDARKTLATLVY
jgi:tetratricopeptide (TPR) repeat protein